jgi:DNA-binding transcriptional LysR family regulator
VALTDAGYIFLDRAQRILSDIAEAKHMVGGYSETRGDTQPGRTGPTRLPITPTNPYIGAAGAIRLWR